MWQLSPGQSLRLRQFEDEFVLYNDLSGDTHLLGESALQVLGLLQRGPASEQALLDSLAGAFECGRDNEFDADGHALFARLAALFLIEPIPC